MKKNLFLLAVALLSVNVMAANRVQKNMNFQGHQRQYLVYTPNGTTAKTQLPVVVYLHGMGSNFNSVDQNAIKALCEKYKTACVLPNALKEQDPNIPKIMRMAGLGSMASAIERSAWGAGASASIQEAIPADKRAAFCSFYAPYCKAGKVEIQAKVNDVAFINALLTPSALGFTPKVDQIYVCGVSLGGAMTYKYAFSPNNKASKVGVIAGFIGGKGKVPATYHLPTTIMHSKTDEVVPFNGSIFNAPIKNIVRDIASQQSYQKFAKKSTDTRNGCDIYDYAENPHLIFYEIKNAPHNMGNKKIWAIQTLTYQFFEWEMPTPVEEIEASSNALTLYPNPVENVATLSQEGTYTVFDLCGRLVLQGETKDAQINLSSLQSGRYILTLQNASNTYRTTVLKK